ncbi:2-hydroxychromene-2-carboxylate isomerase [Algihabitans albus]|uniref:2-hydroxychromene-2-carboxylate isomerase n=1 Tax=Algihabitans albus TaxID=2164067 RepID=UPI001ABC9879|nr:2-hydroxychromene-2-carboxylate isomerase [Algihabitans albus]
MRRLDYYLSLRSPWAFLGSHRLEQIAQRHRIKIAVKPVDFGVVFPASGGLPLPKRAPQRLAYRMMELKRWSAHLGVAMVFEPSCLPAPEGLAARFVIAAEATGGDPLQLAHAVLAAIWQQERNIAEVGTLEAIAAETGHNSGALAAKAFDPETQFRYEALTQEALERGVFGAPSYVLENGEIFWGQDRLEFLERALVGESQTAV